MQFSTRYIFIFTLVLCLVSSCLLSVAAVGLRGMQESNQQLDKQKSVLLACRLVDPGASVSPAQVQEIFKSIQSEVVDLGTKQLASGVDPASLDPKKVERLKAPANAAGIMDIPKYARVFHVMKDGKLDMVVLPIYGKGLWSTLQGFLALDKDLNTIRGITYYDHKETPGLGGEVDNPRWKNRWPGRKAFDESGQVAIKVIKGAAGDVAHDPYHVDGLSGATLTSRGVSEMLAFWLGPEGFGPYLDSLRKRSA